MQLIFLPKVADIGRILWPGICVIGQIPFPETGLLVHILLLGFCVIVNILSPETVFFFIYICTFLDIF